MDMPPIDYEAVLVDLEARRAQIDKAIEAVQLIIGLPGGSVIAGPVGAGTTMRRAEPLPAEIRGDTFFRMNIGDAAAKYLKMSKAPKTLPEIAEALTQGGITHASKNFQTTLHVALSRAAEKGILAKVKRGQWGLAEWYPGMKRRKNSEVEGES